MEAKVRDLGESVEVQYMEERTLFSGDDAKNRAERFAYKEYGWRAKIVFEREEPGTADRVAQFDDYAEGDDEPVSKVVGVVQNGRVLLAPADFRPAAEE